jgi:hypothetical protein
LDIHNSTNEISSQEFAKVTEKSSMKNENENNNNKKKKNIMRFISKVYYNNI